MDGAARRAQRIKELEAMICNGMKCPEEEFLTLNYMFETGLREVTATEHINFLIKLGLNIKNIP